MVFGLGTFWKSYRRGDINDFAWQHCRSSDGGTGMTENPGPGAWNADPVVYTGWKCTFSCTMRQSRNRTLILALAGLAAILFLVLSAGWADAAILGISVAAVLVPAHRRFRLQVPAVVSALLIALALFAILLTAIQVSVGILSDNVEVGGEVATAIGGWISDPGNILVQHGLPLDPEQVADLFSALVGRVEVFWDGLRQGLLQVSLQPFFFSLALFLSLWRGERAWDLLVQRAPVEWTPPIIRLLPVAKDTLRSIFVVHALMVAITFLLSLLFFAVLGYGHVLFFSFVTALCELVPIIGASLPMAVLGVYALALGDLRGVILVFLLGYGGVALLPELTVRPILMGRSSHVHPLVMFFGFMGGILLLGTAGFVLGPLILAMVVSEYRFGKEKGETSPQD